MSDIQLFRYSASGVKELSGKAATIEKELQSLIESRMDTFLGVRFLDSEYSTGKTHRGRIDSLGLDEITARSLSNINVTATKMSSTRGCFI